MKNDDLIKSATDLAEKMLVDILKRLKENTASIVACDITDDARKQLWSNCRNDQAIILQNYIAEMGPLSEETAAKVRALIGDSNEKLV